MFSATLRTAARPALRNGARGLRAPASRRFASSNASPADRPRSWKSGAVRWGLAIGAVYYYNTHPVFADELRTQALQAPHALEENDLPTVDAVIEQKRKQIESKSESRARRQQDAEAQSSSTPPEKQPAETPTTATAESTPEALEQEAGQEGAFNPETGEINWDCPCLGGMAHGPCGEDFKTAFSCFVYSEEDPKGMDCIDKFQSMQDCFRKYPEIYGAELSDDEADEDNGDNQEFVGDASQAKHKETPHIGSEQSSASAGEQHDTTDASTSQSSPAALADVDVTRRQHDATEASPASAA